MAEPNPRQPPPGSDEHALTIRLGRDEVVIRQRYEVVSIANDILIALWFLAGSVMFFFSEWQTAGTWCFVAGSGELLARPVIRLTRHVHLLRMHQGTYSAQESSQDF